jgi:hypothetical protein
MTPRLADYIEAGYALTPDERVEAARMLLLSVEQDTDDEQADIEAEWDDTIGRRLAEVMNGTAKLVDGPESIARIRAELAARRK